jgi:Co/Zn/Cd efflux system component
MGKMRAKWDHMEEAIRKRAASEVCLGAIVEDLFPKDRDDYDSDSASDEGVAMRKEKKEHENQCGKCTSQICVLALTAFLFAFITIAQFFAAIASNSQALLVDCVSMGVDALTYLLNIGVECIKGTKLHRVCELVVGAISLFLLTYFTLQVTLETLPTLTNPDEQCTNHPLYNETDSGSGDSDSAKQISDPFDCESAEEDDVNPYIVLAFAIFGIIFDCISLTAFMRNHRKTHSGKAMNIWTAIMHVGADFIRSTSTFVASMLMLLFNGDSAVIDAWCTMIISFTILLGAIAGIIAWFRKFLHCLCSPKCGFTYDDDEDEGSSNNEDEDGDEDEDDE